jgi:hypothetical protein
MFFVKSINFNERLCLSKGNTNASNAAHGLSKVYDPPYYTGATTLSTTVCDQLKAVHIFDALWSPSGVKDAAVASVNGQVPPSLTKRALICIQTPGMEQLHVYFVQSRVDWVVSGRKVMQSRASVTCTDYSVASQDAVTTILSSHLKPGIKVVDLSPNLEDCIAGFASMSLQRTSTVGGSGGRRGTTNNNQESVAVIKGDESKSTVRDDEHVVSVALPVTLGEEDGYEGPFIAHAYFISEDDDESSIVGETRFVPQSIVMPPTASATSLSLLRRIRSEKGKDQSEVKRK